MLILTILCTIFVEYVWDTNVGLFVFLIEVFFLVLIFILDTMTIAIYKEWHAKEAPFGLMGVSESSCRPRGDFWGHLYHCSASSLAKQKAIISLEGKTEHDKNK
jgi:hypothetical protein|nr:hypothetical protein [Bacillota bacterium]